MSDARKRKLDAILVWRFDRFARSTKHLLLALEEFRSLGIQFVSYQENIDTSSPLGQALFTIVGAVAQLERDLNRERVTAGVRNARANGTQRGRPRRIVSNDELIRIKADGASPSGDCCGARNRLRHRQNPAASGELKSPPPQPASHGGFKAVTVWQFDERESVDFRSHILS